MSQATPSIPLRDQLAAHRAVAVTALLALLATVAIVLVLAIDGGSTPTPAPSAVAESSEPQHLSNGRPDESATAAAISPPSVSAQAGRPDESGIAAAIGSSQK
jgi:hypothetical protein